MNSTVECLVIVSHYIYIYVVYVDVGSDTGRDVIRAISLSAIATMKLFV